MAAMAEDSGKGSPEERFHDYHAEAHVLSGDLQRPVEQKIEQLIKQDMQKNAGKTGQVVDLSA